MPPVVIPFLWIGGIVAAGWGAKQGASMLENASTTTKWAVAGGALYVSYKALQSAGAIK